MINRAACRLRYLKCGIHDCWQERGTIRPRRREQRTMSHAAAEEFPYALTSHALRVIYEREIALSWIVRVLNQPLITEPDAHDPTLRHALGHITEREGRILRVVYNETTVPWRIVTVYLDRRQRGRL